MRTASAALPLNTGAFSAWLPRGVDGRSGPASKSAFTCRSEKSARSASLFKQHALSELMMSCHSMTLQSHPMACLCSERLWRTVDDCLHQPMMDQAQKERGSAPAVCACTAALPGHHFTLSTSDMVRQRSCIG